MSLTDDIKDYALDLGYFSVGITTADGELHQSMILDLEKKLGDTLGTYAVISDRRQEYVNAIGLSQLILTWRCLEKLAYLLRT